MNKNLLKIITQATKSNQAYAIATVIEATLKGTPQKSGAKMIVLNDGTLHGTIGGGRYEKQTHKACLKAIKAQKASLETYQYFGQKGQSICGGQIKIFIEPVKATDHLIICGAGHIALPLSTIAKILNFKVTVIDNRKAFANKKRFPHVDKIIVGDHAKNLAKAPITDQTYVMIVTQGNEFDYACLKTVIKSNAKYIGVISSKLKKDKFIKRLRASKIDQKFIKRIDIPAGLDLGGRIPEEIAVSIMAKMIKIQNKKLVGTSKFK